MIVGILLFQAVAFSVLSAIVANNKNRSLFGWSVIGFLFGLFGFVAALVVEKTEPKGKQRISKGNRSSTSQEFNPDEHEKKCPTCAEYIKLEAKACRYCGHEFSDEEVKQQIEKMKREFEKQQEKTTQKGTLYCERHDTLIRPEILNADGRCPVCGNPASDEKHPLEEEISGDGS